ncbi:hypothetical protein, partial [Corallococcus soli]
MDIMRGVRRSVLVIAGAALACSSGEDGGTGLPSALPPMTQDTPGSPGMEVAQPSAVSYFLAVDSSTYRAGAAINVAWSAPSAHSMGDWVGLYRVGDATAAYLARKYVPSGSAGLLTFSAPVQSGTYEVRYVPEGGTASVGVSTPFTVSLTAGNIFLFSNYEGGNFTLVVDQNLPNIQLGIATYKATTVTLTGPYVNNVSTVLLAGYASGSTVTGIDAARVQRVPSEPVTRQQPYSNNHLVYATGWRIGTWTAGGGNSKTQIEEYFMSKFGEVSVLSHMSQYSPFNGSIPLSQARLNMVVVRDASSLDIASALGRPSGPVKVTVDVNAAVGSSSALTPALTTGMLVAGSTVHFNNYASILGAGGAGGSGGNG